MPSFPFASSSTFPLLSCLSLSPLLSFPSTFLDIWSGRDTQVTVFTAKPALRCIHSFLHCFLAHSLQPSHIPSMPTPPCPWLLTGAYFTVAHIKQPDEGNTVGLYDPSQGHIVCLSVCFGLKYWGWERKTGSFCSEHLIEQNRRLFCKKSIRLTYLAIIMAHTVNKVPLVMLRSG